MSGGVLKMPLVLGVSVGAMNWITPQAELEDFFFPSADWLVDAIHEQVLPLPGYRITSNQTNGEVMRRNKEGV